MTGSDERYNGWANRETWAFWLHVTNDEGWYNMVREQVGYQLTAEPDDSDSALGEAVVAYVREELDEALTSYAAIFPDRSLSDGNRERARDALNQLTMMRDEIGSWWRIDYAEIGAAARELVSE